MVLRAAGKAGPPSALSWLFPAAGSGRLRRRQRPPETCGGGGGRRQSGLLALAGLGLLLLSACDTRVNVEVDAGRDGSGEVKASVILDERATAQVPDLERLLRLGDLEAAGWRVRGPSRHEQGGTRVEAAKSFRSPAGAARAVAELSGAEGPFRDFHLDVERSYLFTRTALRGEVDLSRGLEGFSDDVLAQRLGSPLGVDMGAVERQLGRPLRDAFHFQVVARLPGEPARVWSPALGEQVQVVAAGSRLNTERLFFTVVAVVAAATLVAVLARRLLASG